MKKRTRQQRIGERGEQIIETITEEAGLIPNRPKRDYGIDLVCQFETSLDENDPRDVSGEHIGMAVRTTEARKPRLRLSRSDVETFLSCNFPLLVAFVHIRRHAAPRSYVRLMDRDLAERFVAFLGTERKNMSLTVSKMRPSADLRRLVRYALRPGFRESLKTTIAEARIGLVLPDTKLEIRALSGGAFTIVTTSDFFAQFDIRRKTDERRLRAAIFAPTDRVADVIPGLSLNPDLLSAFAHVPSPVLIAGRTERLETRLCAEGPGGTADCPFDGLSSGDWHGFVHESGFSIRFSKAMEHEGRMVHWIEVAAGDAAVHLPDHPDLMNFLSLCTPGAKWLEVQSSTKMKVEDTGDLARYGYFSKSVETLLSAGWLLKKTADLRDVHDPMIMNTLLFLAELTSADFDFGGWGFSTADLDRTTPRACRLVVPICGNLGRTGVIARLGCSGECLCQGEDVFGFRLGRVHRVDVQHTESPFELPATGPVVVASPKIEPIQIVPEMVTVDCDASPWGLGIRFREL